MTDTETVEWHEALRKEFPPGTVGKLPKGGVQLDFVGHAAVTDRLLSVDPNWSWEPFGLTEQGLPALDEEGNLWIRLTVCGVTRPGCGDGRNMKERIGDAIRNASMRYGVALSLWSKDELESGHAGSKPEDTTENVVPLTRESPLQKAVDAHPAGSGDKVYLNVPYADKGEAKSAGARWDGPAKRWYVSASADLTKFSKWLDDEGKVDKAIAQVVEAFSDGTPVVEPPPEYSDDEF